MGCGSAEPDHPGSARNSCSASTCRGIVNSSLAVVVWRRGISKPPVYPGSDTLYVKPIPYIDAEYTTRYIDFLAGVEDGIGLRVKAPDHSDVSLTLAINPLGVKRDPKLKAVEDFILHDADEIKQFLGGTPTVESPLELFGTIKLDLSFAKVSSTVTFLPITVDYKQADLAK